VGLTAEFTVCADLLTDSGDFTGEELKFIDHSVYDIFELDHDETLDWDGYFLREIATSDSIADTGDVLDLGLEEFEFLDGGHARLKGGVGEGAHRRNDHGRGVIRMDYRFAVCVESEEQRPATAWTVTGKRLLRQ